MNVPGSNLLNLALSVQGRQVVQWFQATGRAPNSVRELVTTYVDAIDVPGSFQPKNRAWAQSHGLELGKTYAMFYASEPMKSVARDLSGDKFVFGGANWQSVGDVNWFAQDGWESVLLVQTGPAGAG